MRTVTVGPERLPRWLDGFAQRHGPVTSAAGPDELYLRAEDGAQAWIEVPFGPLPPGTDLVAHAQAPRRVGVLLVRRGGYAAGVFAGTELIASKVGAAYVQGTTKAGGWSQQRYARRRANQARAAFADAADVAAAVLPADLDVVVCGGDRAAVDAVLADPRLTQLAALVRPPWLTGPDPRLRVLAATPEQFRAVRIRLDP